MKSVHLTPTMSRTGPDKAVLVKRQLEIAGSGRSPQSSNSTDRAWVSDILRDYNVLGSLGHADTGHIATPIDQSWPHFSKAASPDLLQISSWSR